MAYVWISFGALSLGVSLFFVIRIIRLVFVAYWLRGVIVDLEHVAATSQAKGSAKELKKEKAKLVPIIEFETPGGRLVKFRAYHRLLSVFQRPTIGAEVGVIYQRNQPDAGIINSFLTIWALPVICSVIGAVLLYGGIELLLAA